MRKILHELVVVLTFTLLAFSAMAQTVFVNEIHYDNASTDTGESIEIAGVAGTDLTGWTLLLYNGSNGTVYNTESLSGVIADQSGGYGFVHISYPSNGIQNGAPDGIALVDALNNVIQFISYEGTLTATDGAAAGLTSTDIGVAETSSTAEGESLQLSGVGTSYTEFVWQEAATATFGAVNNDQTFGTPTIPVVINEFVFNHTGSDTKEFVEILSNPNTDLSEYTVLEIEGDGTGAGIIDEVITLGTTDSLGYYTTPFASNQFENGTVSLLLVKNFSGLLGDDIDTDDDGVTDTLLWDEIADDIAVNDGGTADYTYAMATLEKGYDGSTYTVGGASRIPNGTDTDSSSDWVRNDYDGEGIIDNAEAESGEAVNTPGAENLVKEVVVEATVLINEIDADTEGTDVLEFVELFDGGVGNVPLDGYTLVFFNGSDDASYAAYDLDGYTTDANGYFVIGNSGVANVTITFSSNGLQNGADAVALYKDDESRFPNDTPVTETNLIDAIVYDTNDSDDSGLLPLLDSIGPQVNEDENGDKDFHSLQRYPNGEGGLRNTSTYVAALPTPGTVNTNRTEEINLIINEVDADTDGTDIAEFIELFDGGTGNISLDGFVVVLYNGNGDISYNAIDLTGYSTNTEGYFVIGSSSVTNVDLAAFTSNGLQNGADAVALYEGSASDFPSGTAVTTTNLVDALVYDTGDSDDAGLLTLLNAGQEQIDEKGAGDSPAHSLQRIPNGDGGARNTSTYTQLDPTPGTENGATVVVPSVLVSIQEARDTTEGAIVTISGILTVADQFNGSAFIQDSTAGIAIYDSQVHGAGLFNIGDSLTITGQRAAYYNMVQISSVTEVINHGSVAPIVPDTVAFSDLAVYAGKLVTIMDATFPSPGGLLFGNTNFELTDASGTGEMRLDADVTALVGLAQPEVCSVTGVVGRYNDIFQLMPRVKSDLPCATEFSSEDGLGIDKDLTLDIVTWNIEWFGDEGNSPAGSDADVIQKDSVKAAILSLNADIIGVEEIADDATFAQMISEIPGYAFILSDATSYPNETGVKQKVGFIYKTATVNPIASKILLATAHPYYNGGDTSMLTDFPDDDKTRFFASGRLPFMLTADVTINGATERISFIDLHARANRSSDAQARYEMRKYDVEALKDTLDTYYADEKIVMLGDYNDDVDETVADINSTTSSFQEYVDDAGNYSFPTIALSDANLRSYVFYPNMIDHIMLTDELFGNYIDNSARVHYEFYGSDYTSTTSDHFPVSIRLEVINPFELVSITSTDNECYEGTNGSATIEVTGGVGPYTYAWSDGQSSATVTGLAAGTYTVTVTDARGSLISTMVNIVEPDPIELEVSGDKTVYPAYADSACALLYLEDVYGGTGELTFEWSTGETFENIEVCPEEETTYTLTVTDENGCTASKDITVSAVDVACGNNYHGQKKLRICYRGKELCVSERAASHLMRRGASLGNCNSGSSEITELSYMRIYPNPFYGNLIVSFRSEVNTDVSFSIYSMDGVLVKSFNSRIHRGYNYQRLRLWSLVSGEYLLTIQGENIKPVSEKIVKR